LSRIIKPENYNITGAKIKEYRLKQKMSQKILSAKLETYDILICRGSLSRIENCQRTVTDYELKALSEILNVPVERLLN